MLPSPTATESRTGIEVTASNPSGGSKPPSATDGSATVASGPTSSPWLKILGVSCAVSVVLLVLLGISAAVFSGVEAAVSALFGGALVILFFGISLLIGHFVGRSNPSGAMGVFVVVYGIKVIGFAGALFALGRPEWLDATWFFASAVATVVLWQIAEVLAFSRTRHLIYDDAASVQKGASHG